MKQSGLSKEIYWGWETNRGRFFTFGGCCSIDKLYRTEGFTWFPQEMPTTEEYREGWENLERAGFQVDYITGAHRSAGDRGGDGLRRIFG